MSPIALSTISSKCISKVYPDIENKMQKMVYRSFGDRLCTEYDVDAILDIGIPPLILQPLVENAMHGLMSSLQGGTVKISIKETENAVSFAVEDNGCGMSEKIRRNP